MTAEEFADRLGILVITDDVLGKAWTGPGRGVAISREGIPSPTPPRPAEAQAETPSGEVFDVIVRRVPRCSCGRLGRWSDEFGPGAYVCCKNLGSGA